MCSTLQYCMQTPVCKSLDSFLQKITGSLRLWSSTARIAYLSMETLRLR